MSAVVGVWLIIGGLGLRAGLRFYRHIKTKQYLDPFTMFPGGFYQSMNRRQALLILGLREPIDPKSIRNKHRLLMMNNHPDNGGSTYLATKINEAKDILLKAITAKAWILIDVKQGTTLRGKNTKEQYEVASLTKMYTFYSCLCLNETLRINPYQTVIKTFSTNVSGTSANLLPQRYIRLLDLYYALMLPSGNDAACLLACYYGFWLTSKPQGPAKLFLKQPISDKIKHYDLYFKKFVQYMNQMVKEFNHPLTHFENPHGLGNKSQLSTASELGEACLRFIKNSLFYAVCGCKNYKGCYYESQEGFQWQNTNILLREGYKGIKTGFTTNAGGCLSSLLEIQPMKYKKYQFLVVVLGSSDAASRFADTKTIVSDFVKYLKMMKL